MISGISRFIITKRLSSRCSVFSTSEQKILYMGSIYRLSEGYGCGSEELGYWFSVAGDSYYYDGASTRLRFR